MAAVIALATGLGPVVFAGWDAAGQPVGKPLAVVREPLIDVAAVSEEQTGNTWGMLQQLVDDAPVLGRYSGLEVMETFCVLPWGRIDRLTASARTVKGRRAYLGILDQTEEWVSSNGGVRLAQTMRTNAAKVGGHTLETPNAFIPGQGSVAEASAAYFSKMLSGEARLHGLLYDHREAPPDTDLSDRDSLIGGLRYVYGCASADPRGCVLHGCGPGWVDLEPVADMFWDLSNDVQMLRADYLNQITHATDSWVTQPDWAARLRLGREVSSTEPVVLGFDGSRGRVRGKADATALIGCCVEDGHLFEIRVWEQPSGPAGDGWLPPVLEVDASVRDVMKRFNVVGFYADPSGWTEQVARWESEYGRKLKVKAAPGSAVAVWPRGKDSRVLEMIRRLETAILAGEMTHDGSASLTRHVLNARRRAKPNGYLLYKAFPDSVDKIDAAYAAVMAWKARLDALASGLDKSVSYAPRRLY
jgi:hypothetical protein